jgi:hypothetical protein
MNHTGILKSKKIALSKEMQGSIPHNFTRGAKIVARGFEFKNSPKSLRSIKLKGNNTNKDEKGLNAHDIKENDAESKLVKYLEKAKGIFTTAVSEFDGHKQPVSPWIPVAARTFCTAPWIDRERMKKFYRALSYEGDGRLGDPKQDDRLNTIIALWGKRCIEAQMKGSVEYKVFVTRGFDLSYLTGDKEDQEKNLVIKKNLKQIYIKDIKRPEAQKELFSAMVELTTKDLKQDQFETYKRAYLMDTQRINEYYDRVKRVNMNAFAIVDPARAKEYKKVGIEKDAKIIFPNTGLDSVDSAAPYGEEVVAELEKLKESFSTKSLQKVLEKNDANEFQNFYRAKVQETAKMIFEKVQRPKEKFEQYMLLSNHICHLNEDVIRKGMRELATFDQKHRLKFSPSVERAIQRELKKEKEILKEFTR